MYFKIKQADNKVIFLTPGPETCKKWHIVFGENGGFDAIRCFAFRRQPKCKNCRLANTIQNRIRRKTSCKVIKHLKRSQKQKLVKKS